MPTLTVTGNESVFEYENTVAITANVSTNSSSEGTVTAVRVNRGPHAVGPTIGINGSTISVTGAYSGVFPRSITYLDLNRKPVTVSKFEDLPPRFFLLTNYTASPLTSIAATYDVYADVSGGTGPDAVGPVSNVYVGTITQTVTNNYTSGKNALISAIPRGQ